MMERWFSEMKQYSRFFKCVQEAGKFLHVYVQSIYLQSRGGQHQKFDESFGGMFSVVNVLSC